MKLEDLKKILRIGSTSRDDQLQFLLEAGIEQAQTYCEDSFKNETDQVTIPKVVQVGIAKFVEVALQTANVQTEKFEGMQRSFFSEDATKAAHFYWRLHRKATYR